MFQSYDVLSYFMHSCSYYDYALLYDYVIKYFWKISYLLKVIMFNPSVIRQKYSFLTFNQ